MNRHPSADGKIRLATRPAFACTALMLLVFLAAAALMLMPFGLTAAQQHKAVSALLYLLAVFAAAGGAFSVCVGWLRRKAARSNGLETRK